MSNSGKLSKKTVKLTVSAVFIAISTVLSLLTVARLPYGGAITPLSMLPIVLVAFMYGVKWGAAAGLCYGLIQAIFGAMMNAAFAGQSVAAVFGILIFDYVVAFSVLGIAGAFRKKVKNRTVAFACGTLVATLLRYVAHIVSGCIFFGSYAQWFFEQESTAGFGREILEKFGGAWLILVYSVIYNGTYMLPEIVLTTLAAAAFSRVKPLMKEIDLT